ncbi:MAG: DNA polymerase III subunit chi [Alphaproteobacteria bacterium]
MVDVWFYHLEQRTLNDVLPDLLTRTLERGWRATIRCGSPEKLDALDKHLWVFDEASFLPHGKTGDKHSHEHPVWLTSGDDMPNKPNLVFLVEGADPPPPDGLERIIDLFDGNDLDAVSAARLRFKAAKDAGHNVTYWQQEENGRWAQKA